MFNSEEFSLDPHSDPLHSFQSLDITCSSSPQIRNRKSNGDKMVAKKREETRKRGKKSPKGIES